MGETVRRFPLLLALAAFSASADQHLLEEKTIAALANEISGESAKRQLEALSRLHRMRGSHQYHAAAEQVQSSLKEYRLDDARIERLPADGKIYYGTQRSRPAWNAEFAELWEVDAKGNRIKRIASWEAMPISLAQDSESGEVTSDLVDVGAGTGDGDYAGKDVRGKLVLASSQPEKIMPLAIEKHGAAGIVSWAQNQKTAWWGEDGNLVRWGHLLTFAPKGTFGFMVSPNQARDFQSRSVRLNAVVKAGREPGFYEIPTATIPGSDPAAGEIVYSCHLDHPRPGANDNASGCATILEVARSLRKLVGEKRLPQPRRTLRFVWPAEIEGTMALLNGRPEIARRIKAAIHLDMVGGGPVTKAVFHVTRGPASLPSFVNDVAEDIGRFVNEETLEFASSGTASYPLNAPEGGKEPLQAEFTPFSMGSDHQVYTDSSFGIPAIYLNDWPDRYIHTNFDVPANIDPTKLKRAAFIAAASGWFLANCSEADDERLKQVIEANALRRRADVLLRSRGLSTPDAANLLRFQSWFEARVVESVAFRQPKEGMRPGTNAYKRNAFIKGPVSVFGYDYFEDRYGPERARNLRLLRMDRGHEYAYEVLNLVDGKRSASDIRDDVSAIYGPVPFDAVTEYLQALASVGIIQPVG